MLGALIGAGASLLGGALGAGGAKSAARAQARSQQAAIDEQRRQYDQTRADLSPYRQTGNAALNQLAALYGIPAYQPETTNFRPTVVPHNGMGASGMVGNIMQQQFGGVSNPPVEQAPSAPAQPATPGAPDFSRFYSSPDYQFALQQGEQALLRNRSAMGGLQSGGTGTELARFGQGLASQQYGNYTSRLAQLAGIGQGATTQLGQFGAQSAGNIGSLMAAQGDARASGIAGQTNAWGGVLNQLGTIAGDYFGKRGT